MGSYQDYREEDGVEDMISLSDLNEHSILKNLKQRYGRDLIYTYTGSILVAVNPYKMFNIYGLDMVKRYEGKPLGKLPPHLFAVASASYSKMIKDDENQVLVISGESGAGKTESTKLVLQYLAAVNKSGNNLITEQILEANPLLESFGNAKTIRNDNSSRFGKYIEVLFKNGSIVGAKTSEYLLEKSRIVTQAPEERNYHVFYEMLEELSNEQKAKYGLQTAPKYFYLNQGGSALIPGRDDADNFRKLTAAMDVLNFERGEQDTVLKILASVLHIGNIYFKVVHDTNTDRAELGSDAEIKWVAHLLNLSEVWLKQALTSKVTEARGDRVYSPYNLDQALDARDAVAKALYCRMFSWLVERINMIVCRLERDKSTSLAVLDIFGFEDFLHNSFEQLCINYANETLQYFFNQHIFRLEQKEYAKEKIRWEHIEFKDNQATLDLIATKPAGILHILDDESNFPQATDHSFLEKCHFHHSGNELYDKPRMSDPEFFVVHYAGKIKYNVQHFLEKNKDTLRSDVIELMCESKNKILSQMFKDHRDRLITKTLSKTTGRYVTLKPRTTTVAASFNESLLSLIDTMSRCNPYFVRCIKPNAQKSPMTFEDIVVLDQLRYTGMLETIKIRKMGYPVRIKFPHFIERYHCLMKGERIRPGQVPWDVCKVIMQSQGTEFKDEYQIGATKVFMKEAFEARLDHEAIKIRRGAAVRLQTMVRMFLARTRHQRTKMAAARLQRMVRMWKCRRNFKTLRNGIVRAQAQFRMFSQRRRYQKTREEVRRQLEEQRLQRRKQEAVEKMERERRERQAQMMANIANLEIPGELALVYNKLDDWELYHRSQHVVTALGDVVPMDMGYKLPVDINSHAFSKYTSVYFKNPSWGEQREPLTTSLTPVQGEENNKWALAIFKLILRFMCDKRLNEKTEKVLADFIIQMGLKYEGLRDELLCQLTNQTWQNQNLQRADRAWQLMAASLCCFNPSPTLFKYLLKYVSDVGHQGFKFVCQHKILQSAYMDPLLSRVYPPTFLEWKAVERKANMALDVKFPDDINVIGHVESWTSGELFTSHLLKLRGLKENSQGWTVLLQRDADQYELMGYDYVLDLLGEAEVPPGFPAGLAHFLVSVNKERAQSKRRAHQDGPHNPERERILTLAGPLPEMIRREIPITTTSKTSPPPPRPARPTETARDELGFSTTSVLNQRPTEILPVGLSEGSRMNIRYTKRSRAPNAPVLNGHGLMNGHAHHIPNGHITTITEDDEDHFTDTDLSNLSHHRLNGRYFPNGDVKGLDTKDLSNSRMNLRYNRKAAGARGKNMGVSGQLLKRQKEQSQQGTPRDDGAHSDNTDWSHLVEDIFSNALNEHDEQQDSRSLGARVKGGGRGVPGLQQPQPAQTLNFGLQNGAFNTQPAFIPPAPLNLGSPPVLPNLGVNTDPLQQIASQQMAQQQAVLQAYMQQQQQQQQQQQALMEASLQQQRQQQQMSALEASNQQTAVLKSALQQQELQNKLLKQSIEQEKLRQQLQHVQLQHQLTGQVVPPVVSPLSPAGSSFNASFSMNGGPGTSNQSLPSLYAAATAAGHGTGAPLSNGGVPGSHVMSTSVLPSQINGTAFSQEDSPSHRVQFIKSSFENRQPEPVHHAPPIPPKQPRTYNSSAAVTRTFTITSNSVANVPTQATPAAIPPPPPPLVHPTISFADGPPLHTQPAVPPPPPPPPPPPLDIDRERGTFTIRDKSGRARTVRIGRVVWPPPPEKEERQSIQVGKLQIDENVASGIESRIMEKRRPVKQDIIKPSGEPKSILKGDGEVPQEKFRRTKSLIETSHLQTLKILEQKLGGGGLSSSPIQEQPSPAKSTHTDVARAADSARASEEENVYATSIVPDIDVPPPPPTSAPPKLKKKIVTETIETTEVRHISGDYSRHIKMDQDNGYSRHIDLAPPPPPPPVLPPLPPLEIETEPKQQIDYAAFERVVTELYPQNKQFFLMYNKVPWILHIRKEVFWPKEKLEQPLALHLVYCQVVSDVHNQACVRITKEQRVKMKGMLENYGVNENNYLSRELKPQVKKVIVDTAKEWPTYFCRLFPIAASGQLSGARYLGVSHTGLRLVTRERTIVDDHLAVLEDIKFEDVVDVVMLNSSTLQLNLRTKSVVFYTTRAQQLKDMIDRFCQESERGNKYAVAVRDYITRESTLLSFRRGDVIKLMDPEMDLEAGWLYGSLNGIVGLFPAEYVKPLARHEVDQTSGPRPVLYKAGGQTQQHSPGYHRQDSHGLDDHSETSNGTAVADGKFSMMEFAMLNFRESLEKYEMLRTEDGSIRGTVKMIENAKLQNMKNAGQGKRASQDWSWKEQADLIKWTRSPIQASLLKLDSPELNKVALECFIAIMRFMGDYPIGTNMTDFDCAKKILKLCHKYPQLRDEVFCQLCKQTTSNRSMFYKSKIRGWRLFALVAAYFDCSDMLRPFLFKYLETTATDVGRTYNSAAALCLNNLRKTFKYGGRKDVPLKEEVFALADGRNCKRFPFFYSGADTQGGMLQVKSCTVVQDAIEDVCTGLNITDTVEMEEYTFFIRTGDGTFSKLNRDDYILDETAHYIRRAIQYDLIFQRTVWYFPLRHMDNEIYVEMMFHQCVLDYIEGFLVILPGGKLPSDTAAEIGYLGAVLHKANMMIGTPTMKDLDALIPRNVRTSADSRPQYWLNQVHQNLPEVARMSYLDARRQFVDRLRRWRLFGSTFFLLKGIPNVAGESMLAVNHEGITFLNRGTHEAFLQHPFSEILSTRRYRDDGNANFLDMKLGNLMVQQILRIETDQGSDISDLIGQYMQVINRYRKRQEKFSPNPQP